MLRNEELCRSNAARYGPLIHRLIEGPYTDYAVTLTKRGQIVLDLAYKEMKNQQPGGSLGTTYFQVGSVTKAVTAALLLKLVESGELSLHDPVQRFIPEWRAGEVTVLHLLTHTSGIDDEELSGVTWPALGSKNDYYESIYKRVAAKDVPGERRRYSTHLYAVLTDVLERVAGLSLERFGRTQLFDPLGMNDTTYSIRNVRDQVAYPLDAATGEPDMRLSGLDATGDSGLCTSASDLLRFGQMLLEEGRFAGKPIYSPATIALMKREMTGGRFGKTPVFWTNTASSSSIAGEPDFRLCFSELHSSEALGHNGFTGCWFFVDPAYETAGAILTNSKKMNLSGDYYRRIGNVLMTIS